VGYDFVGFACVAGGPMRWWWGMPWPSRVHPLGRTHSHAYKHTLMALSVRPGMYFAISAHLFPCWECSRWWLFCVLVCVCHKREKRR
jgi:hypothetical protein